MTEEKGVSFDYLVKPGPATTRNAIELLSVLHYPQEIITKAKNEAAYFDQHRQWL